MITTPITHYHRILQSISYIMNKSNLPFASRMHIYETLNQYLIIQDDRINQLETKITHLEIENQKQQQKQQKNQ
jgi:hypothetical protein